MHGINIGCIARILITDKQLERVTVLLTIFGISINISIKSKPSLRYAMSISDCDSKWITFPGSALLTVFFNSLVALEGNESPFRRV